jgi:hypothetical protein
MFPATFRQSLLGVVSPPLVVKPVSPITTDNAPAVGMGLQSPAFDSGPIDALHHPLDPVDWLNPNQPMELY